MPLVTHIYGGVQLTDPRDWQHQPGDHSDTGTLPLLSPVIGTAGHVAVTAAAHGAVPSVTVNAEHIAIAAAAHGATGPGAGDEATDGDWFPPMTIPYVASVDDEDEELLLVTAVMRHRFRI